MFVPLTMILNMCLFVFTTLDLFRFLIRSFRYFYEMNFMGQSSTGNMIWPKGSWIDIVIDLGLKIFYTNNYSNDFLVFGSC